MLASFAAMVDAAAVSDAVVATEAATGAGLVVCALSAGGLALLSAWSLGLNASMRSKLMLKPANSSGAKPISRLPSRAIW